MTKRASIFTELYWLVQDQEIKENLFFLFLEFFWPRFHKISNYIFLKESFSKEQYIQLKRQKENIEFWINLITVDDFFLNDPDQDKKSAQLAKSIVPIWKAKLKQDFPTKEFIVEYIFDEENGDYGLTFYQTKFATPTF